MAMTTGKAEDPVPAAVDEPGPATRFASMNGLRLLAAALIVLFHAASSSGGTGFDIDGGLGPLFALFDVGVPIFFVLSGFLLYRPMVAARLTGTSRRSVGRYGWHRLRRIAPAYWVVLLIAALLHRAEVGTGSQPWRIAAFLQIYDPVLFTGGLVVAWSLCTEVAFYVYLPVHDRIMRISRGAPATRVLHEWSACLVLLAVSVAFKLWMFSSGETSRSAYLPRYLDTFALGMALAVLSVAESKRRRSGRVFELFRRVGAWPWVVAAGLVVVLSWYHFPPGFEPPTVLEGTGRDLVKLLVAALVITPLVVDHDASTPLGAALAHPVMRRWGDLSFGIFLIHLPLLTWIQEHLRQTPDLLPTLWLAVVALAASTALAGVLYAVVEWPLRHVDPFDGEGRSRLRAGEAGAAPSAEQATATLPAGTNG